MHIIDWDAHGKAIKKQNKRRIHITKLVHDILPTNKQVHRQNRLQQRCPTCDTAEVEDRDHVMRCSNLDRDKWRAEMKAKMEETLHQLQTDPGLTRIFMEGVHKWLQGAETLQVDQYPQKFRTLITQQNAIGWRQLFNGRLSREWARHQNEYLYLQRLKRQDEAGNSPYALRSGSDRRDGNSWTVAIIGALWEQWFLVWSIRNEAVHGHDQTTRAQQRQTRNRIRLQDIYNRSQEMEPRIRDELLFETADEHLEQSHRS